MAGPSGNGERSQTIRRRKRLWLIPLGIGLLLIIAGFLWLAGVGRDRRSADERLAEIEAARAIPDAENAALIYDRLLQDPNAASLLTHCPQFLEPPIFRQVCNGPWLAQDHPELTAWIKEHRYIIDRLQEASRLEKCRFPLSIDITDTSPMNRAAPMRQWAFLLTMAANNDLAEGRTESALAIWQCLLRMEGHLRQQPVLLDHLLGNAVARLALESVAQFVMTGTPTESCLQKIEAMPLPLQDRWAEYERQARLIDDLVLQRVEEQVDRLDYIRHPIQSLQGLWVTRTIKSLTAYPSRFADAGKVYRRSVAMARGVRILVALRQFRNTTGRWPASLDETRASLPAEVLTDPLNQGPFMYKPAADMFQLYSRGPNTTDEGGKWDPDAGADDWPIWPLRDRIGPAEPNDASKP